MQFFLFIAHCKCYWCPCSHNNPEQSADTALQWLMIKSKRLCLYNLAGKLPRRRVGGDGQEQDWRQEDSPLSRRGCRREFGAGSRLALAPSLLPSSPHRLPLRPRAQSRAGQHRGACLHSGVKCEGIEGGHRRRPCR